MRDMAGKDLKKSSASVSSVSETKQNVDELPDDFEMWTESKWNDTDTCELCAKKFSFFTKRHHWYLLTDGIAGCVGSVCVTNVRRA